MNYEAEIEDYLNTGGDALTYPDIGTSHTGQVVAVAVVDDQYNEGKRIMRIDLNIGDETRSLWVRAFGMRKAISKACAEHSLGSPRVGGTLTVVYSGDGEASQTGFNRP